MAYKAFVSSTFEDLKEHRGHVITSLRKAGIVVDPMEDWTAARDEPKKFSQSRVRDCDLCVLLVGFRRGHVPRGHSLSVTQLEYRAAVEAGIDVLAFMLSENAPWPREFDELDKDQSVREWRAELKEHKGIGFFGLEPDSIEIAPALTRWIADRQRRASDVDQTGEAAGRQQRVARKPRVTMSTRSTFGILTSLIVLAFLLIAASLLTDEAESVTTLLSNVTSLVAAVVPLVAAVKGARTESAPRMDTAEAVQASRPAKGTKAADAADHDITRPQTPRATSGFRLGRSFETGIYGGLIGGAVAGLALALAYTADAGFVLALSGLSEARVIAEIFVAGCLCGTLIGAMAQFGVHWFRYRRQRSGGYRFIQNEIVGGMLFGAVAGIVAGAIVAVIFGPRPLPMIDGGLLIGAAVIGGVALPAGALFYDFQGAYRLLIRAFLLCAVLTGLVLVPAAAALYQLDVFNWFYTEDVRLFAAGGSIIGGALTTAIGAEVGATVLLYGLWRSAEGRQSASST